MFHVKHYPVHSAGSQKDAPCISGALSLTNFRNYRSATLSLAQGLTIFTGPNGAGKSNILEAIHCLATGRSFRARSDAEMRSFAPDPDRPYTRVAAESRSRGS